MTNTKLDTFKKEYLRDIKITTKPIILIKILLITIIPAISLFYFIYLTTSLLLQILLIILFVISTVILLANIIANSMFKRKGVKIKKTKNKILDFFWIRDVNYDEFRSNTLKKKFEKEFDIKPKKRIEVIDVIISYHSKKQTFNSFGFSNNVFIALLTGSVFFILNIYSENIHLTFKNKIYDIAVINLLFQITLLILTLGVLVYLAQIPINHILSYKKGKNQVFIKQLECLKISYMLQND